MLKKALCFAGHVRADGSGVHKRAFGEQHAPDMLRVWRSVSKQICRHFVDTYPSQFFCLCFV
jgi:hypothetical protein